MEEGLIQRTSVYISSRAHLNLSFNLCESGITTFLMGGTLQSEAEDAFILQYVNRGTVLLSDDRMSFRISAVRAFSSFRICRFLSAMRRSRRSAHTWMR